MTKVESSAVEVDPGKLDHSPFGRKEMELSLQQVVQEVITIQEELGGVASSSSHTDAKVFKVKVEEGFQQPPPPDPNGLEWFYDDDQDHEYGPHIGLDTKFWHDAVYFKVGGNLKVCRDAWLRATPIMVAHDDLLINLQNPQYNQLRTPPDGRSAVYATYGVSNHQLGYIVRLARIDLRHEIEHISMLTFLDLDGVEHRPFPGSTMRQWSLVAQFPQGAGLKFGWSTGRISTTPIGFLRMRTCLLVLLLPLCCAGSCTRSKSQME